MAKQIKAKDFDITKLQICDINPYKSIYMFPFKYNYGQYDTKLILETQWIKNTIKFAANSNGREQITVALDDSQDSCQELKFILNQISNTINSNLNVMISKTSENFSTKNNSLIKYKENPIQLCKSNDPLNLSLHDLLNLKLVYEYDSPNKIKTIVKYQGINQNNLHNMNIESFSDIESILVKDCEYRLIIVMERISFNKFDLSFGKSFKVLRIDIKAPNKLPKVIKFDESDDDLSYLPDNYLNIIL